MEALNINEIMEALNGRLLGEFDNLDAMVEKVETDSRTISEGALFLPLSGERFDGHAYINEALEAGAAGCLTQRERESYPPAVPCACCGCDGQRGKDHHKGHGCRRAQRAL